LQAVRWIFFLLPPRVIHEVENPELEEACPGLVPGEILLARTIVDGIVPFIMQKEERLAGQIPPE
jgi:hypothetical protein